ncbi:hypothetical protein KC316_g74 [Hortaea werneckii]|nr:hypothetical protein KC316_g74 [Hortaea werneckii]
MVEVSISVVNHNSGLWVVCALAALSLCRYGIQHVTGKIITRKVVGNSLFFADAQGPSGTPHTSRSRVSSPGKRPVSSVPAVASSAKTLRNVRSSRRTSSAARKRSIARLNIPPIGLSYCSPCSSISSRVPNKRSVKLSCCLVTVPTCFVHLLPSCIDTCLDVCKCTI